MKKVILLIIIPALLLTSCRGKAIPPEEAKKIMNSIHENKDVPENVEFNMKVSGVSRDDKGENQSTNLTYHIISNENDETRFEMKGTNEGTKYDLTFYTVKNETYEEVTYVKEYDKESKDYNEYTFTKKDNISYSTDVLTYQLQLLLPGLVVAAYSDPTYIDDKEGDVADESGHTTNTKINYYSTGEKNLTVEIIKKVSGYEKNEGEENSVEGTVTATYDDLMLKKLVTKAKSNYGNNSSMEATLKYSDNLTKITLPNGWEKHIA